MRVEALIIIVAGVIVVYLLWCKLSEDPNRKGDIRLSLIRDLSLVKDHVLSKEGEPKLTERYTVSGGSWQLNWAAPSTGTAPFTYDYEIHTTDVHGVDQIVQSGTNLTTTNVILDPTKLIPDPNINGGYMSGMQYTADVKATNAAGIGPVGQLSFVIYDTPTVTKVFNEDTAKIVYPAGGDIFYKVATDSYVIAPLSVYLVDEVPKNGIIASITINGKTYPVDSTGTGTAPSASWALIWNRPPATYPAIGPNTAVTITASFTNQAGTGTWSNTFTTPGPDPIAPGAINGQTVKFAT